MLFVGRLKEQDTPNWIAVISAIDNAAVMVRCDSGIPQGSSTELVVIRARRNLNSNWELLGLGVDCSALLNAL